MNRSLCSRVLSRLAEAQLLPANYIERKLQPPVPQATPTAHSKQAGWVGTAVTDPAGGSHQTPPPLPAAVLTGGKTPEMDLESAIHFYGNCSVFIYHFSDQYSLYHPFTHIHSVHLCAALTIIHDSHTAGTAVRGRLGFSILPKDTLAHTGRLRSNRQTSG